MLEDSVDVSGGNVLLRNLLIENTGQGISAGEGSIVLLIIVYKTMGLA